MLFSWLGVTTAFLDVVVSTMLLLKLFTVKLKYINENSRCTTKACAPRATKTAELVTLEELFSPGSFQEKDR